MKIISSTPKIDGSNYKIAIILTRFNDSIGKILHENVIETLKENSVSEANIETVRVPGSLEAPLTAKLLARQKKYDAIIALGAIIKGDTHHFDLVCSQSHRGLMDVSIKTKTPIIFGILTTYNEKDAIHRAEKEGLNKGREYALAALEMAQIKSQLANT
ncbi:6,7-dimethyl-8-ribityllumazine synthase [Pseudomonadota bacterium]